jgi:S-adenosylmethionine-diacylglycerol 3-amino-3-carboxypropyl transferase
MQDDISRRADFSTLRYAQCWEDADILLDALDIQPGHTCLSIASAGDNTLALLSRAPARVIALDLSPAQLASLELRAAAYRVLSHPELLQLIGSRGPTGSPGCQPREQLYARCRGLLSPAARGFWDSRPALIRRGIGRVGKFEHYLSLFRRFVLPLVHPPGHLRRLLQEGTAGERQIFYDQHWDTPRWRLLLRLFCSRPVMSRLGRDPAFFAYAQQSVSGHLLARIRHALTVLDPRENPYLQWIVAGQHISALPYALRPENFAAIRANLDRLEWRCQSLEAFLTEMSSTTPARSAPIDRFNLSNIFEYMAADRYRGLLQRLAAVSRQGARLAYWNMVVPRTHSGMTCQTPGGTAHLRPLDELSQRLYGRDKAFFYHRFCVEEVTC